MKKGFTLLELLAVIVILAVISLITIGIVGGIIDSSKKSAFKASAYGMVEAANFWYMKNYDDVVDSTEVRYPSDEESILKIKGKSPDYGKIVISTNGKISLNIYNEEINACAIKSLEDSTIEVRYDYNRYECYIGQKEEVGEDIVEEGYITMYLYYPEDSYDRMWRLGSTTGIRSDEVVDEEWQDYMGSVTVPIDRASDIWISYKLDSSWITIPPSGKMLVDIKVNTTKKYVETVKINIDYDKDAEEKLYKIGNSSWIPYTGEIVVAKNTVVQAKVVKTEKLYDSNGTYIGSTKKASTDRYEIKNVKAGQLARPSIKRINTTGTELARVKINYPAGAVKKYYQINYKGVNTYSEELTFAKYGDVVTAYYYDETGKKSQICYMAITNNEILDAPFITADTIFPTTKVVLTVTYPDSAYLKYYKIDDGAWKIYTGQITLTSNNEVYAMYKDTNLKESLMDSYEVENITSSSPNRHYILGAPSISATPGESISEQVEVSVNYPVNAEKKYIKIGNDPYIEYTGKVVLTENKIIRAYYQIGTEDSNIAYYNVDNIGIIPTSDGGGGGSVYVAIKLTPNTSKKVESVLAKIVSKNADIVMYSINNGEYIAYTTPLTITENCVIRAFARGKSGTGKDYKIINNILGDDPPKTPKPPKKDPDEDPFDRPVITFTPDLKGTTNKALSVMVSIAYDPSATKKQYEIDGGYPTYNYTGPFEITANSKITAIASNEKSYKESSKTADWLYEGMVSPIIETSPSSNVSFGSVEVAITYGSNATSKKYKINNGPWIDYTTTFEVNEEATVFAESSNEFETKMSSYKIENIVPTSTKVVTIDKGKYYLIKLNYPDNVTGKEYKYKESGTWKTYNQNGILLIKGEYKDEIIKNNEVSIKIEDENGEYISFYGDYYILDVDSSKINESFYMKWGVESLYTPTIFVDSEDLEAMVKVNIYSDRRCTKTEYKKTEPNKTESDNWSTYTSPIEVTKNDTIIKARCNNASGTLSKETSYKVINIDSTNPVISSLTTTIATMYSITSKVVADDVETAVGKYEFSINGGAYINNGTNPVYKFTNLLENTSYNIKVRVTNSVGMYSEYSYVGKTVTIVSPTISVTNEAVWKPSKMVTLSYPLVQSDKNFIYEYQIDGEQWITYVEPFELSKNATINARVRVDAIVRSSSKIINYIDATEPTISLDGVTHYIMQNSSVMLPTSYYVNTSLSGGSAECLINGTKYINTSVLAAGAYNLNCTVTTGAGVTDTLNKSIEVVTMLPIISDNLYSFAKLNNISNGIYSLTLANGTTTTVEYYKVEGNTTYATTPTLCDNITDDRMCVIRYTGNLTINSGVTITPQVRKRGLLILVDGTITNNGTISMTARGACAVGQDLLLFRNVSGTTELVPARGAIGGAAITGGFSSGRRQSGNNGYSGSTVSSRATAGGGTGNAMDGITHRGGYGTSYSGGTGSEGAGNNGDDLGIAPSDNGCKGGSIHYEGSGGTGNPGGTGDPIGSSGTGGLMIIYARSVNNTGIIESKGTTAAIKTPNVNVAPGGSSGGGSINIFYSETYTNSGTFSVIGGLRVTGYYGNLGGAGGTGTISIGSISSGTYVAN